MHVGFLSAKDLAWDVLRFCLSLSWLLVIFLFFFLWFVSFLLLGRCSSMWRVCTLCSELMQCGTRSPCEAKQLPELRSWDKLLNRVFQNSGAYCKAFVRDHHTWWKSCPGVCARLVAVPWCDGESIMHGTIWDPCKSVAWDAGRGISKNSSGMGLPCSYSSMLLSVPGAGSSPS